MTNLTLAWIIQNRRCGECHRFGEGKCEKWTSLNGDVQLKVEKNDIPLNGRCFTLADGTEDGSRISSIEKCPKCDRDITEYNPQVGDEDSMCLHCLTSNIDRATDERKEHGN